MIRVSYFRFAVVSVALILLYPRMAFHTQLFAQPFELPKVISTVAPAISTLAVRYQAGGNVSLDVKVDAKGRVIATEHFKFSIERFINQIVIEVMVKKAVTGWRFAAVRGKAIRTAIF